MQTVRKKLVSSGYAMIDNRIARIERSRLSDGGFRLYVLFATLQTCFNVTDNYLLQCLAISKKSLLKYKKELKALDLIKISRKNRSNYYIYIGSLDMPASKVELYWTGLDEDMGSQYTERKESVNVRE